jgi:hypothetical protein
MIARGRLRGALIVLLVGVALGAAETAFADSRSVADGNDRPGPLDIRAAGHGHSGTAVTHRITTFSTWRARLLGPNTPNLFAVDFSTDGDPGAERIVVIYSVNGRMRADVFRPNGVFVGRAAASKPNARTATVSIPRVRLGSPTHYRWTALSLFSSRRLCRNGCLDEAPNTGRILHDITAPRVTFPAPPLVPASTTYDIDFRVSDAGRSGLRDWRVQHRLFGEQAWTTVQRGSRSGPNTHQHTSPQDTEDQFRILVRDRQGNMTVSAIRNVWVPVDDSDTDIAYVDMWASTPTPGAFLSSVTSSSDPGDTATFQFTGRFVAWVAPGGGTGMASVSIDGGPATDVNLGDFAGLRQRVFTQSFSTAVMRTLTLTVNAGPVPVDGFIVR